jgi:hypothetical protein
MLNKNLSLFNLFLIIFTLLSIQYQFAQAPDTLWTKIFGGSDDEFGYFAEQTSDGGYIITGWTKSFGAGLNDVWLVKTNSMGDTLWTKTYGGNKDENVSCVQQTSDGGYILFTESDSFDPTYWKVWLIKTDATGDTSWTKLIGESKHYFVQSGLEISGGDYIFVGYHKASGAGQEDLWLVKTDASGDTIWTKTYGGGEGDLSSSIKQTNDGGYIISASTKSFGAGDYDCWLIRTDASGDTIWTKTYGGTNSDYANSVQQTSDNGFILAGATRSFGTANNYNDVWLIKTNSLGDTIWTKTFGGSYHDGALSVQQTLDGGYILVGYTGSFGAGNNDVWLIKTNASGDTLWTKTLGGIYWDVGRSIEQTSDGGYIIGGDYYETSTNSYDFWLIKIATDQNEVEPLEEGNIPDNYILKQNYPNPFNPVTTIDFGVPVSEFVTLAIYNLLGEQVGLIVNEELSAGNYKANWDAKDLTSGVYFYRIQAGEFVQSYKMILIK